MQTRRQVWQGYQRERPGLETRIVESKNVRRKQNSIHTTRPSASTAAGKCSTRDAHKGYENGTSYLVWAFITYPYDNYDPPLVLTGGVSAPVQIV